jgi:hypothetical protein
VNPVFENTPSMRQFFQLTLFCLLLPLITKGQGQRAAPIGALIVSVDTPYLRRGIVFEYNADFIRFKPLGIGKDTTLQFDVTKLKSFTLLKEQIQFEVWPLAENQSKIVRIQNKFGSVKLAKTISDPPALLIREDTLSPVLLDQNNYRSILEKLSASSAYSKDFLPQVLLKSNSIERYLGHVAKKSTKTFSHLKTGITVGYNNHVVNLTKIMGSSFADEANKAYKQRFQLGAWTEIPFGTTNNFSLWTSLAFFSDDQAFTSGSNLAGIRSGLSIKSYYLELPLLATAQLPPISVQKHWYTFFRGGFVFRQRLAAQARKYRIVQIQEGIDELQFTPVELGYETDFGLSTVLALNHPLSSKTSIDISLQYLYFLQRDLYTSHLRLAFGLGFGK